MCPGQVPGSRSYTVSEMSTTLAPESDAKSKPPPLPIVPEATHERIHRTPHVPGRRSRTCPLTVFLYGIRRNARLGGFETRPYTRSVRVKIPVNNLLDRIAIL